MIRDPSLEETTTGRKGRIEGATTSMTEEMTIGNGHETMAFNLETGVGVLVEEAETMIVIDSLSRGTDIDTTGETEMEEIEGAGPETETETETTDAETGDSEVSGVNDIIE